MTDRELLELAAKAAGIAYFDTDDQGVIEYGVPTPSGFRHWNPITDDGDALRLAVKLEIDIGFFDDGGMATSTMFHLDKVGTTCTDMVDWENDPYAATRLAIVRAAAEIGRNMK